MILAGIDYSYTSPAICVYDTDDILEFENLRFYNFHVPKKKTFLSGKYGNNITITAGPEWKTQEQRFRNIANWAIAVLKTENVDEVVLEGYAMGSKGGMVFDIAENTALLKQYLDTSGVTFYKHAPTLVKKEFTGKGNSKKDVMIQTFKDKLNIDLKTILGVKKDDDKPIDDLVDAFANLTTHPYFKETE